MSRAAALAILMASCSAAPAAPRAGGAAWTGVAMGSTLEIEVQGSDESRCRRAIDEARAEIDRIARLTSVWQADSPLQDVNRAAGVAPVAVCEELYFLIERCLDVSRLTDGAFDISFGAAGRLWNWRAAEPRIPTDEEIAGALRNVGWSRIVLDPARRTVFLPEPGMRIGMDAIVPGYAADRAMAKIRALGLRDACINMSGDVLVSGLRDGRPWRVAVAHPRQPRTDLAVLSVTDAGVSTSGDYERFFIKDGRRFCHIIDPRTGWPADRCQSVTVLSPALAFADALATGLFVLGPDRGLQIVESLEGVEAVFVGADGKVAFSKGLRR